MSEYYLAICTSGHVIESEKSERVALNDLDLNSAISAKRIANPVYVVSQNYCLKCGGEILTQCKECGSNIHTEYTGPPNPAEEHIPDYCHSCGEPYPWTATIEAEKQREGNFLEIDDSEIDGFFYPNLVYEINLCYKVQADAAVLVLNRKLIESLIVDILRSVFTMDRIELFYENGQSLPLSKLIDNMKSERAELKKYASNIDEGFFRALDNLKYHGDASAHAIEADPSQEDLTEKSGIATTVAKILFRIREEAKTAHRNQ